LFVKPLLNNYVHYVKQLFTSEHQPLLNLVLTTDPQTQNMPFPIAY